MSASNLFTGQEKSRMPGAQAWLTAHATTAVMIFAVLVIMVMFLAYYSWKHKPKAVSADTFRTRKGNHPVDHFTDVDFAAAVAPLVPYVTGDEALGNSANRYGLLNSDYSPYSYSHSHSSCSAVSPAAVAQGNSLREIAGYEPSTGEESFQSLINSDVMGLGYYTTGTDPMTFVSTKQSAANALEIQQNYGDVLSTY